MFTDEENQHFPFKEHMKMCPELPNRENFLSQKREAKELHAGQMLTSAKIKLQLFPINEGTRIGLEKDGHNPYLELILSDRKKISSILEHLGKKWGSSGIAKGELILFPYNIMENQSDCSRWTINDSYTTVSTAYAALGSPALFWLRYGWFLREAKELHAGQMLTSAKIKLQLFPINEGTQKGLEKDGHNPYLELTLSDRKKISSILEHLGKKWGSSGIAKGELILFPYNIMENQSDCCRWTINDSDTTISTVYAALGSPAIFRLKYGWFLMQEPRSFGIPPTPVPFVAAVFGGCNGNEASETVAQKIDNAAVDPMDNEPKLSSSLQQSSSPWIDILSNISIGGLLSEASLQGRLDSKSFAGIQPCEIATDSLDAFIAAQINQHPVSRLSAQDLHTSILDAEETCHAFPCQKLSSPTDVQIACGKDYSVVSGQDVSSNLKLSKTGKDNEPKLSSSLQHLSSPWIDILSNISMGGLLSEASLQGKLDPKSFAGIQTCEITTDSLDAFIAAQMNQRPVSRLSAQDGPSQNPPSGKTQTESLFSSRPYDDERSLGLTGINWNDSMGPFDFGMPAQKLRRIC